MNDKELRDHFAGLAMQSLLSDVAKSMKNASELEDIVDAWVKAHGENVTIREGVAKDSYQMADAMMEARDEA